jgi:RNA polymerase sigma factor (sigma-70 family)
LNLFCFYGLGFDLPGVRRRASIAFWTEECGLARLDKEARTDEILMVAHAKGDASAINELVRRYGPLLTRIMAKGMRTQSDTQDLVQQAFLQLHRARNDYHSDKLLRPWLITIAMNVKRMHLRKLGRRKEAALEESSHLEPQVAPVDLEKEERNQTIREAIDGLPEGQRMVVHLHWIEGLPFEEVASIVGASKSAVKVRAHRAYALLRERLAEIKSNRASDRGIGKDESNV